MVATFEAIVGYLHRPSKAMVVAPPMSSLDEPLVLASSKSDTKGPSPSADLWKFRVHRGITISYPAFTGDGPSSFRVIVSVIEYYYDLRYITFSRTRRSEVAIPTIAPRGRGPTPTGQILEK